MNWYIRKLAQIWKVELDDSFEGMIKAIYELEYKRSMLRNFQFNGMEVRKQTILAKIESNLMPLLRQAKAILVRLFETWLNGHALLDKKKWSKSRVETSLNNNEFSNENDEDEYIAKKDEVFKDCLGEYLTYADLDRNAKFSFYNHMFNDLLADIEQDKSLAIQLPAWSKFFKQLKKNYKQHRIALAKSDPEFIFDHRNINIPDAIDFYGLYDDHMLKDYIMNQPNFIELVTELYEYFVFDKWFQRWEPSGIVEIRAEIEKIYRLIKDSSTIDGMIAAVNLGLHAVHVNGDMIQYLADYGQVENVNAYSLRILLSDLTLGAYNKKWNRELASIGSVLPFHESDPKPQVTTEPAQSEIANIQTSTAEEQVPANKVIMATSNSLSNTEYGAKVIRATDRTMKRWREMGKQLYNLPKAIREMSLFFNIPEADIRSELSTRAAKVKRSKKIEDSLKEEKLNHNYWWKER